MLVIMLIFMGFSTLVIHSATINTQFAGYDMHNLRNYGLGFVVLIGVSFFNYRLMLKASPYIYGIGIILLVAVYLFGVEKNSAKGWFSLPMGLDVQPAELVKLFIILLLAYFIARRKGDQLTFFKDILPIGLFVLVPFVLVLIQPDLGNAVIYLVILVGMLWIGNVKYTHVLIGVAIIAAGIATFLYVFQTYHDPIQQYLGERGYGHWVARIDTFINPESASFDQAYQVNNSIRAIGSGLLLGEGYLLGTSVHKGFIPYAYSDSVFVVIGEEFGFVGSSALLLVYFLLIYRMVLISIQCRDRAGSFIIIGIISMFVFQIFQNIGMLIGIMPLTGITLPFISYGGTSLLINMMSIGIVMSIKMHQEKPLEY
nr:FtsW/RodA/SpoVE family cell cycle protein [Paenibacillus turpanensis]